MAEREGFVSLRGIEKRQVIDFEMSTILTILTLFEKLVHNRYTAIKTNNVNYRKWSDVIGGASAGFQG
jgi:hypothetical protein